MSTEHELRATSEFLHREFGADKFDDPRYLRWCYETGPEGAAIQGIVDDDHGRLATYALVPQRWRNGDEVARLGITVDACVRSGAQRSGVFRALAADVFERSGNAGLEGTLTIANANSTPVFIEKLGMVAVGGLPVRATVPVRRGPDVTQVAADETALAAMAEDAQARTTTGWVRDWDIDSLRWRLASPVNDYVIHRAAELWCISTRSAFAHVPVAVVLSLIPRAGRRDVDAARVIGAVGRHHRAPMVIHAGRHADVRIPGVAVPRRLLPSPLNLLVRGFGERPTESLRDVTIYEFLDTDHY